MTQQQPFRHPLFSTATLYERMFRMKPYTKCVMCLANDKLKCRKCMQEIIEDITKSQNMKRMSKTREAVSASSPHGVRHSQLTKDRYSQLAKENRKSDKENIMITSKYNMWLAERIRKRKHIGAKSGWPRKAKSNEINFDSFGATQPRFERWQKKLIDQLTLKKH